MNKNFLKHYLIIYLLSFNISSLRASLNWLWIYKICIMYYNVFYVCLFAEICPVLYK